MVEAAVQAGIPANDDFNGPRQEGAGYYQTTTTSRRRWSSARAYLRVIAHAPATVREALAGRTKP